MAPTGGLDLLWVELPNHTRASIRVVDSSQQKAFDWLSGHQNMTTLPESRKRQLFVLAIFYYAMDGPNWRIGDKKSGVTGWMTQSMSVTGGLLHLEALISRLADGWSDTANVSFEPCNNASEFQSIALDNLQLYSSEARMPPEIALLTSLRSISLYNNSINASLDDFLPSELYQLTNLKQLNLSSNHHLMELLLSWNQWLIRHYSLYPSPTIPFMVSYPGRWMTKLHTLFLTLDSFVQGLCQVN
jgi:hypothetical protein